MLPVHLFVHFLEGISSSEATSLLLLVLPLLRVLASGRKCVTAHSSWTVLRNLSHIYTHTNVQALTDTHIKI